MQQTEKGSMLHQNMSRKSSEGISLYLKNHFTPGYMLYFYIRIHIQPLALFNETRTPVTIITINEEASLLTETSTTIR